MRFTVVKNLYRFIARIERVVYVCDSSILLCLHGSPRDPARGHPSLSQACVTHWPICMCNMYCASPRILKDARATKNYDVLKCMWVSPGFPIRIGTDAPRRVKAATREGHPAPGWRGSSTRGELRAKRRQGSPSSGPAPSGTVVIQPPTCPPRESHGVAQLRHARECQPRGDRPRAS